jgi:pimeloyl-ACP methyl ester carboxylesterase
MSILELKTIIYKVILHYMLHRPVQCMKLKTKLFMRTSAIAMAAILITLVISSRESLNFANAQTSPCDNGTIAHSTHILPVILVHGYNEGSWVWSNWEHLLSQDHIPFCAVTFHNSDDECGSASDHATELGQIIQDVKHLTGKGQVNIVTHSKGGLDARVYLANIRTTNVANLIMIGTPNAGDVLANFDLTDPCKPAVFDLQVGASDTMATQNHNTNYYTIAGVCFLWPVPNDGLVPVYSVESLGYSTSLGHTLHCHMSLLDRPEYNDALGVLTGG